MSVETMLMNNRVALILCYISWKLSEHTNLIKEAYSTNITSVFQLFKKSILYGKYFNLYRYQSEADKSIVQSVV